MVLVSEGQKWRTLLNEELHNSAEAIEHMEAVREKRGLQPGEVIWIIDGLDYLETDDDRNLQWLKDERLKEMNLILTSRSNEYEVIARGIANMLNRTFRSTTPPPPSATEIRSVTIAYLHQFAKGLSDAQLDRIARFPLFKNILVLQYFLQELVQFGVYEELDNYIDTYLRVNNTEELISLVLDRLEKDYGEKNVRTYFGMLSLTNCGIPEVEMQTYTGLSTIGWAAFSSALSFYTNRTNQMLTIRKEWKEIAAKRYCTGEEEVKKWRKKLIKLYRRLLDKKDENRDWLDRLIDFLLHITKVDSLLHSDIKKMARMEIIRNKIQLEGIENAFRNVSLMEVFPFFANVDILNYYKEYINGSARKFLSDTNYMSWYAIAYLDLSTMYTSVMNQFLPSVEERKKIYKHIRRLLLPKSVKKPLLDELERFVETDTKSNTPIEDTWETTDINNINYSKIITVLVELISWKIKIIPFWRYYEKIIAVQFLISGPGRNE